MFKFFKFFVVAALISGFLASCGGKVEETYVMTNLRDAAYGKLLSPGFKFSFSATKLIAAHEDVALGRDGNLIEFFTGQNIESMIGNVGNRSYIIGARKIFNPFIHFSVDWIYAGGDSIRVGQPYEVSLPKIFTIREYTTADDYKEVELGKLTWNQRDLRPILDSKFKVENARVSYEELTYKDETKMFYTIDLENVRFIVEDPEPFAELLLKACLNEKLFLKGGLSFGGRPTTSQSYRRQTQIAGPVKLEYVVYSNRVITSG